jgi:hypothetical protein
MQQEATVSLCSIPEGYAAEHLQFTQAKCKDSCQWSGDRSLHAA